MTSSDIVIRKFRSIVAVMLVLGTATACNPYQCLYQTRFISTAPDASANAAGTFTGWVSLRDYSDGEPTPVSVGWNIQVTGAPAPITTLTLRDKRVPATVIATLDLSQSGVAASASAPLTTRAERDRVFEVLSSGNAVLVAETSSGSVQIPLVVSAREDWHHGNCS